MRFMVSYEKNKSQSRDGHCHPKRQLHSPSHHNQISSSPSLGHPQCDSLLLVWRGSGEIGPWSQGTVRPPREAFFKAGEEWWRHLAAKAGTACLQESCQGNWVWAASLTGVAGVMGFGLFSFSSV